MARFDVYALRDGGLAIDCQTNALAEISTRFVVPLLPPGDAPPANARLNPTFDIEGETLVMVTQFATAIRVAELRKKVASLSDQDVRIISAIDVLTGSG
ncbi:CcdB family protein [uncultured Sphingomonas sp.]|uniref:CcdB family protein n=1 Tax=uncultured Sphingomonas sp. TaxID=158754 RepID=UPI0035C97D31